MLAALALAACSLGRALAQSMCLAQYDPGPELLATAPADPDRLVIDAGSFELNEDATSEYGDQVEIRYRDTWISAERARYDADDNRVSALGQVTLRAPDVTVFGEDAVYDADTQRMSFARAGFDLPKRPARGSGQNIVVDGQARTLSLSSVLFTTCPPDNMAWELRANNVFLDTENGFGTARGVRLEFKGVPILYSPYFTFPIDDRRKSGFLTPDFSERDRTGFDLRVPYYVNIRPNLDLTLEPRYMSKRGTQLNTELRYLLPDTDGQLNVQLLPSDDEALGATRRYFDLQHETAFGRNWEVEAGIREVSDAAYFEDLGNSLSETSQTHLDRYVDLSYYAPYWSLRTRFQNYQTIDPAIVPEDTPYERVPQILFDGRWLGRLFAFDSATELVNFDRDVGVTGWRLDSTQEVSLRFGRPGMYLTPAVAWRHTNYWLDDTAPGQDDSLSRSLPVGSLDAGLRFERDAGEDSRWLHTLEPRLLYVNVPFEDQSQLPVFDTIVPDFNLVQLFRKYQYVGPDRIADTDQISFGVTTRLIEARTGRERLTATLGQTRYLSGQEVVLPEQAVRPEDGSASDYVAELSVGLRDAWSLDVGYQWNNETESSARTETRFQYRPKEDRLFGFAYRYRRGVLQQGDVSVVWPAAERWRVIGRFSYSFFENEPLEQFLGWEYEACCWRLRVVGRRFVSSRTGEADDSISIQLELKGLSQRVPSPEDLLDRGILGYRSMPGMTER
ncbi:MAG TPA: LPS assembly protein LptD [Gammaproteobacteria bacterium]